MAEATETKDISNTGRKRKSQEDVEVQAIQTVLSALRSLTPEARSRVVEYTLKRLGLMSEAIPIDEDLPQLGGLPSGAGVSAGGVRQDIRSLTREKNPKTANEMAAVVAYYLSELAPDSDRKTEIDAEDLKKYFKQAPFPLPKRPDVTLFNAKNAGYLDNVAPGRFKLNPVGYNLVVHSLGNPEEATVPRRRRPKKKSRKNKARR